MLVNGQWKAKWDPVQSQDDVGRFVRQNSQFRNWITPDGRPGPTGTGGFAAEPDRYHLYVGLICPWASRVLMVRALKGLEDLISVSVVNPSLTDEGWRFGDFPGADSDDVNGATFLHEQYTRVDPSFTGRATVPVLWDKQTGTIVNNESADIIRMLNTAFDYLTDSTVDLYPAELAAEIDELNDELYSKLNNGVYQAGFATTQAAYEEAYANVFEMLDTLDQRLADERRYLFGTTFACLSRWFVSTSRTTGSSSATATCWRRCRIFQRTCNASGRCPASMRRLTRPISSTAITRFRR